MPSSGLAAQRAQRGAERVQVEPAVTIERGRNGREDAAQIHPIAL